MHIWKGDIQEVSVALSYFGLSFDPDKTDDRRLKKLDDRYSSVNADLLYNLRTDYGHLGLRLSHDILDNGDGFSAEFSYRYPYMFENICLTPSAGLRWDSEDQTGYYFGVSSKEARKSGLKEYSPNDAFSPYVALYANWEFTENWSLTLAEEVVFLSDEIRDSPMVNESQIFTTTIGLSYKF